MYLYPKSISSNHLLGIQVILESSESSTGVFHSKAELGLRKLKQVANRTI